MFVVVKGLDNSIKKAFNSSQVSDITDGADFYALDTGTDPTITARGSGYSDDEIAQSDADIVASFGTGKGYEISLSWGKGVADVTVDSRGQYTAGETPVVSVEVENLTQVVAFAATASLQAVAGESYEELDAITISNPGVYTVTDPSKPFSFKIVLTKTDDDTEEENAEVSPVVSNYLASVKALIGGGGFTNADQTLTLDEPAVKAGQANKAAVTATFEVNTFKQASVSIGTATFVPNYDRASFAGDLAHRESLLSQGKTLPDGSPPGVIIEKY